MTVPTWPLYHPAVPRPTPAVCPSPVGHPSRGRYGRLLRILGGVAALGVLAAAPRTASGQEPKRKMLVASSAPWKHLGAGRFRTTFTVAATPPITSMIALVRHDRDVELLLNGKSLAVLAPWKESSRLVVSTVLGLSAAALKSDEPNVLEARFFTGMQEPFDLQLLGSSGLHVVRGPFVRITHNGGASIFFETDERAVATISWRSESGKQGEVTTGVSFPQALHEVHLRTLPQGEAITYRVELRSSERPDARLSAGPFRFFTPARAGQPFRFVVYGDTRSNPKRHAEAVQRLLSFDPALVIHTGDMSPTGRSYERWGRDWFGPARPMLESRTVLIVPGNHDRPHPMYRWYAAAQPPRRGFVVDWGDVRFIGVDMAERYRPGSRQYREIERALETAGTRWKVIVNHENPYSCVPGRIPGHRGARKVLVPLFEKYRVDVVFSGHDHVYARTTPINGVTYIVSGGGGAPSYRARPQPYTAVCERTHHLIQASVKGDRMTLKAVGLDGRVIDQHVLRKR